MCVNIDHCNVLVAGEEGIKERQIVCVLWSAPNEELMRQQQPWWWREEKNAKQFILHYQNKISLWSQTLVVKFLLCLFIWNGLWGSHSSYYRYLRSKVNINFGWFLRSHTLENQIKFHTLNKPNIHTGFQSTEFFYFLFLVCNLRTRTPPPSPLDNLLHK